MHYCEQQYLSCDAVLNSTLPKTVLSQKQYSDHAPPTSRNIEKGVVSPEISERCALTKVVAPPGAAMKKGGGRTQCVITRANVLTDITVLTRVTRSKSGCNTRSPRASVAEPKHALGYRAESLWSVGAGKFLSEHHCCRRMMCSRLLTTRHCPTTGILVVLPQKITCAFTENLTQHPETQERVYRRDTHDCPREYYSTHDSPHDLRSTGEATTQSSEYTSSCYHTA